MTAQLQVCGWNGGSGSVVLTYDTTSLIVQSIDYANQNPQPAAVWVKIGASPTVTDTLAANTPSSSINVASRNWQLVRITNHFGQSVVTLPANVGIGCRYPA